MKVNFNGKEYEAKPITADLYILDNGSVVSSKDCKPVKEPKPKAEAEPKPKKTKKAE